jgi:group I intron endonuclease
MLKDLQIYNIRTMTDYSKSRIYKIWCDIEGIDEFYIGSSNDFKRRCRNHLTTYDNPNKNGHNQWVYQYIRNNGGFENFYIDVIEKYKCKSNIELRKREQEWIDLLKPTLNYNKAYATVEDVLLSKKKYNDDNKEYFNELKKKRYLEKKTEINKKASEKIKCTNCDKEIRRSDKAKHLNTKYCQNYIKVNN